MNVSSRTTVHSDHAYISPEDYLVREEQAVRKHEYVDGRIYLRGDCPNGHNRIAGNFLARLYGRLRGTPFEVWNSNTKVRIRLPTHTRFYYPDGIVVRNSNGPDDVYQDWPVVVAEVLSPSTRRIDSCEKRDGYLMIPTLTDYLLIDWREPVVEVYHRTTSGFVRMVVNGIESSIPLDSLGTTLPLAELYERIDFITMSEITDEDGIL